MSNEPGTYRSPPLTYALGWLCFKITMLWPDGHLPPDEILTRAGGYAHDGRQFAESRR